MIYKGERDIHAIITKMNRHITSKGGKIDYIEFVEPDSLEIKKQLEGNTRVLMAAYIGSTRLIDNFEITV